MISSRRTRPVLVAAFAAFLAGTALAQDAANPAAGYAQVDDIRIYYERRGSGVALLMLHGGFGTTQLWRGSSEVLAHSFDVIVPDARGRGRTGDGSGPITPGRTARDVIGLMDRLGIARAHVVGHSAGSLTAIHLLIDYPERVLSATLVGSPMMALGRPNAALRQLRTDLENLARGGSQSDPDLDQFAARWKALSPDPAGFGRVMGKMATIADAVYSEPALRTIRTPVLVVKAGRDRVIDPEDFDRLAAAIPGAQVADFPEGTHGLPAQAARPLAEAIERFIAKSAGGGS